MIPMKALLIVFVFVLFVPIAENSLAQSNNTEFSVFVQTQIRNSNGHLVAYTETEKVLILEPQMFDDFLDQKSPLSNMTRAGQNFELVRIDIKTQITQPDVISKTALGTLVDEKQTVIVYFDHNGFPVVEGDTITSTWTVIRPARGF
jgi:hypothetical protein